MVKHIFRYLVTAVSLYSLVHSNMVTLHLPVGPLRASLSESVLSSISLTGRTLGLAPLWRMYSPVPRMIYQVEIYVRPVGGEWILERIPDGSGSLSYRRSRGFLAAWFWDFKLARVHENYFYFQRLTKTYVNYLRHQLEKSLNEGPLDIRLVYSVAPIPEPSAKGDWTPYGAKFEVVSVKSFER